MYVVQDAEMREGREDTVLWGFCLSGMNRELDSVVPRSFSGWSLLGGRLVLLVAFNSV